MRWHSFSFGCSSFQVFFSTQRQWSNECKFFDFFSFSSHSTQMGNIWFYSFSRLLSFDVLLWPLTFRFSKNKLFLHCDVSKTEEQSLFESLNKTFLLTIFIFSCFFNIPRFLCDVTSCTPCLCYFLGNTHKSGWSKHDSRKTFSRLLAAVSMCHLVQFHITLNESCSFVCLYRDLCPHKRNTFQDRAT